MILRVVIGILIGAALGAALGYYGQCTSGACPLTANPFRGAIYGAVIGVLFSLGTYRPKTRRSEPPADRKIEEKKPPEETTHADL